MALSELQGDAASLREGEGEVLGAPRPVRLAESQGELEPLRVPLRLALGVGVPVGLIIGEPVAVEPLLPLLAPVLLLQGAAECDGEPEADAHGVLVPLVLPAALLAEAALLTDTVCWADLEADEATEALAEARGEMLGATLPVPTPSPLPPSPPPLPPPPLLLEGTPLLEVAPLAVRAPLIVAPPPEALCSGEEEAEAAPLKLSVAKPLREAEAHGVPLRAPLLLAT